MTDHSADSSIDPRELLNSVRDLTRRVRAAQRGTWFPLLLFGVLVLGSIPVIRYGGHHVAACGSNSGARVCGVYSPAALVYWVAGLILGYAAIALFYLYRSRRRGFGARIRPYPLAGAAIAVLVTGGSLWFAHHPSSGGGPWTEVVHQLRGAPVTAIGLALLVLAWVERNRALAWFALGYLIVVLIPASFFPGMDPHHPTPDGFIPRQVVIAAVLLLGSLGFALTRPGDAR
jgi:hypothetical protein